MATLMKWIVGLAFVVALVWLVTNREAGSPDASEVSSQRSELVAAASAEGGAREVDPRSLRVAVAPETEPEPEPAAPDFVEVRVRTEGEAAAVAGASVLFVKPGFAYDELPPEQRDRYSRSSESYLRDFGLCQVTDENGSTRVPIEAARWVVVARKGELYGTNWPRSGGLVQEIVVSEHHTLVVETADALGHPIPHVEVVGQPAFNFLAKWTLGTTDDDGLLTYVLAPAAEGAPEQLWLAAELLGGPHGREVIDLGAPPAFVRLTLPATGTVRASICFDGGSLLDRAVVESLRAELSIVGAEPRKACYAQLDAEGRASFENVVLGQPLQLRFPGLILQPKAFEGPTEAERLVSIVQTVDPMHPFVVGTLTNPRDEPVAGQQLAIFCRRDGHLLASVGTQTDDQGRFLAYLSETCIDKTAVEFTLGTDLVGTSFAREARVPVAGALNGRVDLGTVVLPGGD